MIDHTFCVIDRKNPLNCVVHSMEAINRNVNCDRPQSRHAPEARKRIHLTPIPKHKCDQSHCIGRSSAFEKRGHVTYFRSFSPFPPSLSLCAKTLLHLPTHAPALTTFSLTTNHHSRSLVGHHTPPQATTSQPPCHIVAKNPHFPVFFHLLFSNLTTFFEFFFVFDNCALLVQSVVALCVGFLVFCRGLDKF